MMREACMIKGINIARPAALLALADDLKKGYPDFDLKEFSLQLSLDKGEGLAAFKKDLEETRLNNIRRFPTLIIRKPGAESLVATGYRPYEALMAIIEKMQPANEPVPGTASAPPNQQAKP
jgi:predicted DsbA family dithiol-disulfide isomerase